MNATLHEIRKQLDDNRFKTRHPGTGKQGLRQEFTRAEPANRYRESAHDGNQRNVVEIPRNRKFHAHGDTAKEMHQNAKRLRRKRQRRNLRPKLYRTEMPEPLEHAHPMVIFIKNAHSLQ